MDKIEPPLKHPLKKYVKPIHEENLKYFHNSIKYNPKHPSKKLPPLGYIRFTVIGNYLAKEFIECIETVHLFYTYKKKQFKEPVIKGVTAVEWPSEWNDLKIKYGRPAFCLKSKVAVLVNEEFLGGEEELKQYLEQHYSYHITFDYYTKVVEAFVDRVKLSGRHHVYMHIGMEGQQIGTFIFMLYNDILPVTCGNFLRLCTLKKGGYSGTPIHRIVKDGWIQCGGYGLKNVDIPCENYIVKHDKRGVLCMANDGRNNDNSTQFFILLQPAEWMVHKYVAFGQLIEGEETLVKIEEVPTYYESPNVNLTIISAGMVDLVPHDTRPYVGAKEFVESHIEDLIDLGNSLINEIMERVFIEIESKERHESKISIEKCEEEFGEELLVKETKRFNREDIQIQLERSHGAEYVPDECSYHHVSLDSNVVVTEMPKEDYYLPLTDVSYPGEKDSVFDFKRLLKGYYCIESDLETDKKETKDKVKTSKAMSLSEPFGPSDSLHDESLNSEDSEEIKEYLRNYADQVSFGGELISKIANLKNDQRHKLNSELLIKDEIIRKQRNISIKEPTLSSGYKIINKDEETPRKSKDTYNIKFVEDDLIKHKKHYNPDANIDSRVEPQPARFSVLTRLCENIHYDLMDTGPTFKQYGLINLEKNNFFLTRCRMSLSGEVSKEKCGIGQTESPQNINSQIIPRELERKISVNYVRMSEQSKHRKETIRSAEYEKHRPSITIEKYKQLNKNDSSIC